MLWIGCFGIEIVGKAQLLENSTKFFMIAFADCFRTDSFLFGADGDRRSVTVAAGHIEDAISLCPVITSQYVAGKKRSDMSDMKGTVCVRPCTANHNIFHCYPSFHLVVTRMLFLQKKKRSHPHKNIVRDESAELTCYHPVSLASHDSKPYQVRIGNGLSR